MGSHVTTESAEVAEILRLPAVCKITGLSKSTIYEMRSRSEFPGPVRLGARAVGWHRAAITAWVQSRGAK